MRNSRIVIGTLTASFILAAAGCQSGDGAKPLNAGITNPPLPPSTPISQSELTAYCPPVTLRTGTAYYNTYANMPKKKKKTKHAEADASAADEPAPQDPDAPPPNPLNSKKSDSVIYQASIDDVTRTCRTAGGTMTMDVAVAGKVVPGPLGKAGTIQMPIRVVALKGDKVLYSKLVNYAVDIKDTAQATQFIFSDPNVSFPAPTAHDIQVFAGYDDKSGDGN